MTRHGLSVLIFLLCFGYANSEPVRIQVEPNRVMLQFAVQEIQAALSLYSISSTITNLDDQTEIGSTCIRLIKHNEVDNQLQPQGFQLLKEGNTVTVNGGDEPGLMYGGLELADQIRLNQGLKNITNRLKNPFIERRGIKFNIPLDGRTPSYDDTGDAAQKNIAEMWNFDFWREFLDDLARYRYNTLTLWNPHPFPSLVHLPNYPDCELEDVCVPAIEPVYEHAQWRDPQFVAPHVLQQMKTVKKMTMDEKIQYWRKVMKYAKERGIAVYIITWNVIMNSAEGKYGITVDQDNPKTIAYLRECTKQLILTYPDLEGIGVTAGENMRNRDDEFDREKWLWQTYGLGVLDAKEKDPDRVVHFIHRVWNSGLEKIMTDFAAHYPDPFTIGFKYARAHLYSSPRPPFADGLLKEMDAYPIKCWWNLRNDDIFHFQWGDPDYVRAFLRNLPPKEKTAGYHMGSDGYVWAREHISRYPETPRQLECKKHWFRFMAWGKLGYDPALSNDYFKAELAYRYANINVEELFLAFTSASKIIPQINRFHWHDWDFQWAPEACFDQRNGFHDVKMFIETRTMEGSGILTIPESQVREVQEANIDRVAELTAKVDKANVKVYKDGYLTSLIERHKKQSNMNRKIEEESAESIGYIIDLGLEELTPAEFSELDSGELRKYIRFSCDGQEGTDFESSSHHAKTQRILFFKRLLDTLLDMPAFDLSNPFASPGKVPAKAP